MDQQEAKLRGTGIRVTRSGDNMILNMQDNVTFVTRSADRPAGFHPVPDSAWLISTNAFDVIGAALNLSTAWVRRSAAQRFDPWSIAPDLALGGLGELPGRLPSRA